MNLLKRAFGAIESLGGAGGPRSLADLARDAGLPKPTLFRILRTLLDLGYVTQDPATSEYALTGRLAQLGGSARIPDLRRRALPLMQRLHRRFNETVNLAVLEDLEIVYVHVLETTRPLRLMTRPDARDPYHSTSLGRAIVAQLPDEERRGLLARTDFRPQASRVVRTKADLERELRRARERGWAEDREENEPGIVCFGVPLLEGGRPVAALSVTLPLVRLDPVREKELVTELRAVSARGLPS
jgi:DNA-binding IclR family transcriptional regulator